MEKLGPKNTYDYSKTKLEEDEIRLLKLYPGTWDSDLIGKLEICRLVVEEDATVGQPRVVQREDGRMSEIAGEYEALSYEWGPGEFITSLTISEDGEMYYLPIKENLRDALQQFRAEIPENEHHLFWIDAVCINQGHAPQIKDDIFAHNGKLKDQNVTEKVQNEIAKRAERKRMADLEKSAQIRKMADIYKQAYNVRVWLGKESVNSTAAIAFIDRILKLDDLDKLANHPTNDVEWDAFSSLMQRPWFRRRWIVQEIAFARYATVHCGKGRISWQEFSTAVSLFSLKHMDLNTLFQRSTNFANAPNYLGEVDALGAKTLVETINALFRKAEDGEVIEHRLPLEALMSSLTAFDASNPHDIVYAILRLSYDTKPGSKSSAASMPQVAQHYFPSPQLSPVSPVEAVPTQIMLDADISLEPQEMLRRESRTGTSSSLGKNLAVPGTAATGISGRKRSNSGVQAAVARKKAEVTPETGLEKEPTPITVDYEKNVFDLCRDFLEHVVGRSRSLDIICVPWAPLILAPEDGEKPEAMPSWIQNISGRPYGLKFQASGEVYGRRAADPLVGTPGTGYRNYSACGKTRSYRTSSGEPGQAFQVIRDRTLVTCGFVLDVIGDMEPAAMNAVIPRSWAEVVGWVDFSKPTPDSFWRTLVADRVTDGPNPAPGYFQLACKWAFSRVGPGANLNTGELLTGPCPSIAVTFLRRVQAVVWDRCLFLSKGAVAGKEDDEDSWLMGLAPHHAKEDDLICILYGCSVPVILRKTPKEEDFRKPKRVKTMPPERRHRFAPPSDMSVASRIRSDELTPRTHPVSDTTVRPSAIRIRSNPEADARPIATMHELASENLVTPRGSPPMAATNSPMNSPPIPGACIPALDAEQDKNAGTSHQHSGGVSMAKTKIQSWEKEYTLIGACYVHGMMDGDGFRYQIESGNKLQEFLLV